MLTNLKINHFKKPIYQNFSSNIENQTLDTLSNMLAIDYEIRLQDNMDLDAHVDQCVENLKQFLKKKKTFKDNDFSSAVMLFSVAIATEKKTDHEKDNKIDKEQGLDQVIETLISMHFVGITKEERSRLRFVLKDLLNGADIAHILNYIHSEPKLVKAVVMSAFKKYQTQIEINNHVRNTLSKIIAKTLKIEKKITKFKQLSGKVFTATCLVGTGLAAMFTGGLALPAVILPAAVLSVALGPKVGERIGGALKSFLPSIKEELKEVTKLQKQAIYVAKKTELMEQKTDKAKDNQENMVKEHVLANLGLELKTMTPKQITNTKDASTIKVASNRLPAKLAPEEQGLRTYGAENRSVLNFVEDLSPGVTTQLPSRVEFPKKSNDDPSKEWSALVSSHLQSKDFKSNIAEPERSTLAQSQSKASEPEKNKPTTIIRHR